MNNTLTTDDLEAELRAAKRRLARAVRARQAGAIDPSRKVALCESVREAENSLRRKRQGILDAEDALAVAIDRAQGIHSREAACHTLAGLGFPKAAKAATELLAADQAYLQAVAGMH